MAEWASLKSKLTALLNGVADCVLNSFHGNLLERTFNLESLASGRVTVFRCRSFFPPYANCRMHNMELATGSWVAVSIGWVGGWMDRRTDGLTGRCSVMSEPLWYHGLEPIRLFYPWDFPGKKTGVVATFSSRGSSWPRDLPDPGVEPTPPTLAGRFFTTSAAWEAPDRQVDSLIAIWLRCQIFWCFRGRKTCNWFRPKMFLLNFTLWPCLWISFNKSNTC